MQSWSPHKYRAEGLSRGASEAVLDASIAARERIFAVSSELTPVLTLTHLAHLTNVPYEFLRSVVTRHSSPYYCFEIDKRSRAARARADKRTIAVPSRQLRWVQGWISQRILSKIAPAPQSFAYHPRSSMVACAERHAGCKWLIKVDVRDFFSSIHEHHVYAIFRSLGYASLISFEMARLCTRIPFPIDEKTFKYRWAAPHEVIQSYKSDYAGYLPMGAPTSPMLSNLLMREFDRDMAARCQIDHATYSRYADDIFISSASASFNRRAAETLAQKCREALQGYGLRVNEEKTTIVSPGARKIVLGLTVNENSPRLSRRFKKRLQQHYYYLMKFPPRQHVERRHFSSLPGLERHLLGLLSFAAQVEPSYAARMRQIHDTISWPKLNTPWRKR